MAELARHLVQRGVEVDVVTAGEELPPHPGGIDVGNVASRADPACSHGALTLYRVRSRRRGVHQAGAGAAADYLIAARPVVRRLVGTRRYHLAHFFFSLPTGALLPFVRLGDLPVVVSLRGSDVPGYDTTDRQLQTMHRLLLPFTRWIWQRADRVVALSENLGQLACQTYPGLEYSVIHNGVDTELFHPRPDPVGQPGTVRCIAVARLIERKALRDLLRAFGFLPRGRFQLEIVGSGPDETELRRFASEQGLAETVSFSGAVDHVSIANRYREADLFTLTPANEAFGNVFAEALASGLPIVASRVGGIPEFVEDGVNGVLVRPGDAHAIAQAILRLGNDPVLRTRMRRHNRDTAEHKLSWEAVTDQYLEVYDEVCQARTGHLHQRVTSVASR